MGSLAKVAGLLLGGTANTAARAPVGRTGFNVNGANQPLGLAKNRVAWTLLLNHPLSLAIPPSHLCVTTGYKLSIGRV
jgi:hypothetical protein